MIEPDLKIIDKLPEDRGAFLVNSSLNAAATSLSVDFWCEVSPHQQITIDLRQDNSEQTLQTAELDLQDAQEAAVISSRQVVKEKPAEISHGRIVLFSYSQQLPAYKDPF